MTCTPRRAHACVHLSSILGLIASLFMSCDKGTVADGPCAAVTCSSHGECVVNAGVAACLCENGFHNEGLECIEDTPTPCDGVTCSSHGQCTLQGDTAWCDCDAGYVEVGLTCVESQTVGPWPKRGLLSSPTPSPECDNSLDRTYYVGPGQTAGDGSLDNPFGSIQEALDVAQPGESVRVLAGTYTLTSRIATQRDGEPGRPICVRAHDSQNRPVLQRWVGDGVETREVCADRDPLFATAYGGEIFLVRHQYHVFDGFILEGRYTPTDFYCRYVESDDITRTRSYRSLVVFAHYGACRSESDGSGQIVSRSSDEIGYGYNGDHSILRNCDIGYNRVDTVTVAADDVLIENCDIHHALRGSFTHQDDAHCVAISHADNLSLRHVDLHQCSGDLLQVDPDIFNKCDTKQWNNVVLEHSRLWTGPLTGAHADWNDGESPGENGLDTKTFELAEYRTHRPLITVRNVEAEGFGANGYISNRSVFNIKYRVDWLLDGVTVHDSQWAFRIRGGVGNEVQGSAHATLMNVVAYDNDHVARIEADIEQLHILNATFGENAALFYHADCDQDPCYDQAGYRMENSLFLDTDLPSDANAGLANLAVDAACFEDAPAHDFSLRATCTAAVDQGETLSSVNHDIRGIQRPQGDGYDVGAFESH